MTPRHRAEPADAAGAGATTPVPAEATDALDIRFVTTGLSPEEVAAATAVLTAALRQAQAVAAGRTPAPRASEWTRSTRLRRPLRGDWRGFTAEGL